MECKKALEKSYEISYIEFMRRPTNVGDEIRRVLR